MNNKLFIKTPLDLRMKKTSKEIEQLNIELKDLDDFCKNMMELGYENPLKDKLVKDTDENEIELIIKDNVVTNLIIYDLNNNSVEITPELEDKVMDDIISSINPNPIKEIFNKEDAELNDVQTLEDNEENSEENEEVDTFDFSDDNTSNGDSSDNDTSNGTEENSEEKSFDETEEKTENNK